MSKKNAANNARPEEFSRRIKKLRNDVALNQGQFADAIGVVQSLVSHCEGASLTRMPSVSFLVRLGNFAAERQAFADAVWFWQQAGVRVELVLAASQDGVQKHTFTFGPASIDRNWVNRFMGGPRK